MTPYKFITGQHEYDRTSEPFSKPTLSSKMVNRIMDILASNEKHLQKQNITLDSDKRIIRALIKQLDRVTTKVFGNFQDDIVMDDSSLKEWNIFIYKWSEDLRSFRSTYRSHLRKISKTERFRRCLECPDIREDQMQKLTEAQKDFVWFIHILKLLPKSSVCQEECAKMELLDLYRQWKKGQLISTVPIMDFIMKTILSGKDSVWKQRLQNR